MSAHLYSILTHTANEEELLDTLTLGRDDGVAIDVWLAEVETAKAVMADDIQLSERAWVRLLISQLGYQERGALHIPTQASDWKWNPIKDRIDLCDPRNFPTFKKSYVTDRYRLRIIKMHKALAAFRAAKSDKAPKNSKAPTPSTPASAEYCTFCKRSGHLVAVCRSKQRAEGNPKQSRPTTKAPDTKSSVTFASVLASHESATTMAKKDLPILRVGALRDNLRKRIAAKQCSKCGDPGHLHLRDSCPVARQRWEDDFEKDAFWETPAPKTLQQ